MPENADKIVRKMTAHDLRGKLESSISQRVERYLDISHQRITPNHYFSQASAECISLYTDGYFLSTVMVTQAVADGIRKLVAERKGIPSSGKTGDQVVEQLLETKVISTACAAAFKRIYKSFRNDVHHMNPPVKDIDFQALAKHNIQALAEVEREVFACRWDKDHWILDHPEYWDIEPDGTTTIFIRCMP